MTAAEKLMAMKQRIEEKASERTRRAGQLEQLMSQLTSEFNVGSLDEGKQLLADYEVEITQMTEDIDQKIQHIETAYAQLS